MVIICIYPENTILSFSGRGRALTSLHLGPPFQFIPSNIILTHCFSCGLVALKLAADVLQISPSKSTDEIEDLLKVAQENGFTYRGEMFSAQDMGLLAKKYYHLNYDVLNNGLEDYVQLIKHLYRGYPVLVPYDADRNHEPCLKRGHKAHWAVVTGTQQIITCSRLLKTGCNNVVLPTLFIVVNNIVKPESARNQV